LQRRESCPSRERFFCPGSDVVFGPATPDGGQRLAAVSRHDERVVTVWEVPPDGSPRRLRFLPCHHQPLTALAFSPDGQRLATAGWGGPAGKAAELKIFDLASGEQVAGFATPVWVVRSLCFSPDGRRVAVAGEPAAEKSPGKVERQNGLVTVHD